MTSINPLEFAFIGGGGTGEMVLIYLAQKAKQQKLNANSLKLHLIDPNGFGSGGVAYGQCDTDHYLNSVRSEMSPWDEYEFHHWCIEQGHNDNVYEFNQRSDNGLFLQFKCAQVIQELRSCGAEINEHHAKADYRKTGNNNLYNIIDSDTQNIITTLPSEQICLTDGYGPNTRFNDFKNNPNNGFVDSPYHTEKLENLLLEKPDAKIVHIGSNAALYDSANSLKRLNNRLGITQTKPLTIVSPFSQAMGVRDVSVEQVEKTLSPLFLKQGNPNNLDELHSKLLAEFKTDEGRRGRSDRRIGLDSMKEIGSYLKTIQPEHAHALLKETQIVGSICRNATPLPQFSHDALKTLSPEYKVARLCASDIDETPDGHFDIHINNQRIQADIIINGTGYGRTNSQIMTHLQNDGLAEIDGLLGTVTLENDKIKGAGFYYAGPATHFGVDGMESFAAAAENIAHQITKLLQPIEVPSLDPAKQTAFIPAQL